MTQIKLLLYNYMNFLVIPSIREKSLKEFLDAWEDKGDWDKIILIEDNEEKTFLNLKSKWELFHFSHKEIRDKLKDKSWIISKKDSACRAFGFIVATEMGADWIISLDDDCHPHNSLCGGICKKHLEIINSFKICKESIGQRTRGFPYRNFGTMNNVVCNMGLWANNGDWDGIQSLADVSLSNYFTPPKGNFLAHPRHRYPFCGMHIFFKRSVVSAMYFPLMGVGYSFKRMDDIWCGWITQKIFEHLGLSWSIGEPWVEHKRASNCFDNLIAESTGIKANEYFWERIYNIKLSSNTIEDCVVEIAENLISDTDEYKRKLGMAMKVWKGLFDR